MANVEGMTDEEFADFCKTPENIARIPAGKIESVTGDITYTDGAGEDMTKEQFIAAHGVDPEIVWNRIQAKNHKKPVVIG